MMHWYPISMWLFPLLKICSLYRSKDTLKNLLTKLFSQSWSKKYWCQEIKRNSLAQQSVSFTSSVKTKMFQQLLSTVESFRKYLRWLCRDTINKIWFSSAWRFWNYCIRPTTSERFWITCFRVTLTCISWKLSTSFWRRPKTNRRWAREQSSSTTSWTERLHLNHWPSWPNRTYGWWEI